MKSAAARPSESVDDGNFHGKLEPSVPILFISLLQIRDGSEALLGTPSSFLLLPAPRVGHMCATGLRDLLQGCPGVAQPGLLWSRIRACQEMISSSSFRANLCTPGSAGLRSAPAYQLRGGSCLLQREQDSICSASPALDSAQSCSFFPGGVKASQQSGTKGWKSWRLPGKPAGTPWPALFPSFHSSQTKAAFLIPCSLKDSFTTGCRSTQEGDN